MENEKVTITTTREEHLRNIVEEIKAGKYDHIIQVESHLSWRNKIRNIRRNRLRKSLDKSNQNEYEIY